LVVAISDLYSLWTNVETSNLLVYTTSIFAFPHI
jgi:hypothetical protein